LVLSGRCIAIAFVCAAELAGCTTLPSLDPIDGTQAGPDGSISINEVVARVKCELYDATRDISRDYSWFRSWGAKVDLDLIVNEQAGLTPSVAFITPYAPFTSKVVGNISQAFSFGLTGGLTSNAIRTETVSFSATFLEVRDQLDGAVVHNRLARFNGCVLPEGTELNSNLGLKQWIDSALGPVRGGEAALLTWGGAVTATAAAKPKRTARGFAYKPPVSIASKACHWAPGSPPLNNPSCRPPIDSITHTLEFTIVKSIGIAPTWTLARFRGQTGNNSFANASRIDTHKLTITLGPSREDLSQPGTNQSLRLLAPAISNAITQSQNPR
jgi:hypothetical protein